MPKATGKVTFSATIGIFRLIIRQSLPIFDDIS